MWRRGDKGRGLIRERDKYGAMHHSSNTGRTKTLSHETGKTFRYFFVTAAVRWHWLYSFQTAVKGTKEPHCYLTVASPCVSSAVNGHIYTQT